MAKNIKQIILSAKSGIVNPTLVTPDFIGQLYINTATEQIFYAKSTAIGDYIEIVDEDDLFASNILTDTSGVTVQDIIDSLGTSSHAQNTDIKLDDGQPNEVTAVDLRGHLDDTNNPHNIVADQVDTDTTGQTVQDFINTKAQANGLASLDGNGKVPISQIPDSVLTQLSFQGTWNANTNIPILADLGVGGSEGDFYIVDTAGSTSIDGQSDWKIGDWILNTGSVWAKVDNSDRVSSVNGQTGVVNLDTDDIPEGTSNLYYTDVRVSANSDVIDAFKKSIDDSDNITEGAVNLFMTVAERGKLGGIETGATADQNASEVPFSPNGDIASTDTQSAVEEVRDDTNTKLGLKADQIDLDNHVNDTNNPHDVQANQINTDQSGETVQDQLDDLQADNHTHANKTELDLITDGDHDVRSDNPHNVTADQVDTDVTGQTVQDAINNINQGIFDNLNIFTAPALNTTTSIIFQNALSESPILEAGNYIIEISYGWNHDATNSDFEGRFTFDGIILGDIFSNGVSHKQEPKDAGGGGIVGTTQQHSFTKKYYVTAVVAGARTIDIDYRTDDASDDSAIWDIVVEIKRVI